MKMLFPLMVAALLAPALAPALAMAEVPRLEAAAEPAVQRACRGAGGRLVQCPKAPPQR